MEEEVKVRETEVKTDPLPDPAEEKRVETPDQTVRETETTITTGTDTSSSE